VNNVVESLVDKARRLMRLIGKHRWLALLAIALVAAASMSMLSVMPERYRASARVYVDTQTALRPLMANLTFQPDIDQQVAMLARTLISRPNVERLIDVPEVGIRTSNAAEREARISRLMGEIKVTPAGSGNLYDVAYLGPSPEMAQRLVTATVQMFVTAGAGAKRRDSQDAGKFIEEQIRAYEAKLVESETRLKDFKVRNFGISGVSNKDYFTRVSALDEEVSKLRVDLSAAVQSRDAYQRELAAEEPQLPTELAARAGTAGAEPASRLETQRKNLDELLRRYTDEHPDVVNARRLVSQLEAEERERTEADRRAIAKGGRSTRAATSPVYQKLRISLAEAEAQVASLRSQLGAKQALLDQVRAAAGKLPQVEAELAQLNRDYDVIRKNYDLMVARRESASLGEKLDESSQLAEFRVVEPPRVSPTPAFPSRLHLAILAMLLSVVAGVAAAVVADLIWPTFDQKAALAEATGRPVLGTVSMLVTPERARARRRSMLRFSSAFAFVMSLQVAWLAWIAVGTLRQ
jgi:polysaccharide chain length determinant protein (PEP-CTERM system associated)